MKRIINNLALIALCGLSLILQPTNSFAQQGQYVNYQPLSASNIDTLVGPVALYPDALLAQVFPASTYPNQINEAALWVENNPDPSQLDLQFWDPSVIAVAHYPTVLNMMSQRFDWTTQLGQAYLNQSSDLFTSVQRLRAQARQAGNLVSTPQQNVIVQGNTIQIVPAQSTVIYVPQYDPAVIYTQPATAQVSPLLAFGAGLALGSTMSTSTVNWNSQAIVYHPPGATLYVGSTNGGGGWSQNYYGAAGPRGYGQAVTASGTGAYGNNWNSAAVAGGTWNGGAYAGAANTNQWANGAQTGSYQAYGAGPNGTASARGWGYQNGDNSAGAFSRTGTTDNGAFSVSGSGWKSGDDSSGSVTASGVNREGDYASKTWTDSDGNISSTSHSGNVFSGSQNGSWANSYADRGFASRSSSFADGFGGGGGFRGGGFRR